MFLRCCNEVCGKRVSSDLVLKGDQTNVQANISQLASVTLNEKGEDAMWELMQRYYRPEFDAKQLIMSEKI